MTAKIENSGLRELDAVPWKRIRYLMTFLMTFSILASFCMRVTLSIAIVAMTNNATNPNFETYDWNQAMQSTALSSFFWGYVVTNIPAAIFITRFGTRYILLSANFICSVTTYLIPLAVSSGGFNALCAMRVIQGATHGFVFPAMSAVLSKWATPAERAKLAAICFSGMQTSNILTLPLSGVLASGSGGWPSIFYLFGSLGMLWCLLWFFFGFDSPAEHRLISKGEKDHIEFFYTSQQTVKSFRTPWLAIAKSIPLWATLIALCVQFWGFNILLLEMPTYMNDVLKYNIQSNGLLAALPYLVMLILIFTVAALADFLIQKKYFKMSFSRKFFTTVGFIGPMVAMIGLSYVGLEQKEWAVVLLILSAGLNSGVYVGLQVSQLDLSPRYASILMGITNGFANTVSMIVPLIVGAIVTTKGSEEQWQTVFWVTAGLYLLGTIVFDVFGSSEVQPWNDYGADETPTEDPPAREEDQSTSLTTDKTFGGLAIENDSKDENNTFHL